MDPNAAPMNPLPVPMAPQPAEPPAGENNGVAVPANPVPPPNAIPSSKAQAKQDLMFTGILLGLAVVFIGVVFGIVKTWARRQSEDCDSPTTLGSFREMYENGELTREEYDQILAKMSTKLKGGLSIKRIEPKPPVGGDVGRNGPPPSAENPS